MSDDLRQEATLYVEFVGLPGSGKTTLRKQVVSLLATRGIRSVGLGKLGRAVTGSGRRAGPKRGWSSMGRSQRALLHARAHCVRLPLAARLYASLARDGNGAQSSADLRSLFLSLLWLTNARSVVRRGDADLILFDQGWLHPARELMATAGIAADSACDLVRRVHRSIGAIRTLHVVLDVDAATAAARVHGRAESWSRYRRLDGDLAVRELVVQRELLAHLLAGLESEDNVLPRLTLDGRAPPSDIAELVASRIVAARAAHGTRG